MENKKQKIPNYLTRKVPLSEWRDPSFLQPSNTELLAHQVDLKEGFEEVLDEIFGLSTDK